MEGMVGRKAKNFYTEYAESTEVTEKRGKEKRMRGVRS